MTGSGSDWSDWSGRPRRRPRDDERPRAETSWRGDAGDGRDAAGVAADDAGAANAYESEWYRSLKALAATTSELRGEDRPVAAREARDPATSVATDGSAAPGVGERPSAEIPRLLGMALEPDHEVRRAALAALSRHAELVPGDSVRRALQDPIDSVRAEAARLADRRGLRDVRFVVPLLGDRGASKSHAVALDVAPSMLARADDIDDDVVDGVAIAVGALESPPTEREREPLRRVASTIGADSLLRRLGDDRARLGAARLLSLLGESMPALRGLAALRDDPNQEIRDMGDRAERRALELSGAVRPATRGDADSMAVELVVETQMLTALARALEDPDEGVRARARAAIVDVDRPSIARWVRESLQADEDESPRLAAEVARLLGLTEVAADLLARGAAAQGPQREPYRRVLSSLPIETSALVRALEGVDPDLRPSAAQLVWSVAGRASLPLLREGLTDRSPSVRIAVLGVLEESADPAGVESATRLLSTDDSPEVRIAAVSILCRSQPGERLRALERTLVDPDPAVRAAGVSRLAHGFDRATGEPLRRAFRDPDERVWRASLPHLAAAQADSLDVLWDLMTTSDAERVDALVDAMHADRRGPIDELCLGHAGSLDPAEREFAVTLAGHGRGEASVRACAGALLDPAVAVRRAAAKSLRARGSALAVAQLGSSLRDPEPTVRVEVLRALGVIDDEAVLGLLVQALHDPAPEVRDAASAVLTEWSSPAVARRLAGVLATPSLRDQAMGLLKKMGPSAAELLVDVLLRSSSEMTPTIGRLLDSIVGVDAFARRLEASDPQQRRRALLAVTAMGGARAVALASSILEDPDQHLRIAALEALADLGDASASPSVARVAESDPVEEVAQTAQWVLGALRRPGAAADEVG
jgi:HEAT repeat protein